MKKFSFSPPQGSAPQRPWCPPKRSSWDSNSSSFLASLKIMENLETKLPWKIFSGWSPCRTQRWPWRQAWQLLTLVEAGHVLVCPRQHWTQLLLLVRRRQTLPLLWNSLPVSEKTSTPSLDFGQKSPCLFQGGVDQKLSILSNSNGDGGEQEGERDGGVEES